MYHDVQSCLERYCEQMSHEVLVTCRHDERSLIRTTDMSSGLFLLTVSEVFHYIIVGETQFQKWLSPQSREHGQKASTEWKQRAQARNQNPFLVTYFHQVGPSLKGSMVFKIVPQDGNKTFKMKTSEGLIRIVAQYSILTQKIEIKYKLRQFHQGMKFQLWRADMGH